jgi:hypothetical protein
MSKQHPVGRVRIRTHEHMDSMHESPFPLRVGMVPSWPDIRVSVVGKDGTETELGGVVRVTWMAAQGSDPCLAILEVAGAEAHANGLVEIVPLEDRGAVPSHVAAHVAVQPKKHCYGADCDREFSSESACDCDCTRCAFWNIYLEDVGRL